MKLYHLLCPIILFISQSLFAQVGINTEQANPLNIEEANLDINGRVIIRNLEHYNKQDSLAKTLGVDKNGVLVKIGNQPTDAAFYQASNSLNYTESEINSFNSENEIPISWNASTDLAFDDLLTFNSADNSFSFIEEAQYEVGGCMNLGIRMPSNYTDNVTTYVAINATIQYMRKGEESGGWKDLSTCRKIYSCGALSNSEYRSFTLNIPLVLYSFSVGDKLRMIVKKPIGSSVGSFKISPSSRSLYSRSLRVTIP